MVKVLCTLILEYPAFWNSNIELTLVNMAHTSQTLEPAELQERAFEYGRQLQLVAPKLANKYSYLKSGKSEGLQDIGTSVNQVDRLVQSEVLNTSDKLLIRFLDVLGLGLEWIGSTVSKGIALMRSFRQGFLHYLENVEISFGFRATILNSQKILKNAGTKISFRKNIWFEKYFYH